MILIYSFQPPGSLHEVFTPTPAIVRGGHFYTYNSLHLTEFSRSLDAQTQESLSNQSHPSAALTIMMMMTALPHLQLYREGLLFISMNILLNDLIPDIRSKSLSAFCRMVLKPSDYSDPFVDSDLDSFNIHLSKNKRIKQMPDLLTANKLAKDIKLGCGLNFEVCHSLEKGINANDFIFCGEDWMDPGLEVEWKKKLKET